ncbi:MAG: outer membrane lipoprotein-sorting protein [Chloroflexota bacterium]|nr:outer membrane lipoprotein-sorting protein [Chloroflexota bacterium]MDQ5865413.1 outer membrane lipoprotein-sorting protein [Chloroflexota bacterium]
MDEDFVRRVLREHAETNMTKQPDLWPALSRQIQPQHRPSGKEELMRTQFSVRPLLVAGLLVVLLAVAIGAATLLNQPRPASAAEVIAKARQVAQNDQAGVQTFHGVMTHWFISHEPAGAIVEGRSEEWYQAEPPRYISKGTFHRSDGYEYETMSGSDEEYTYLAHEEDETLVLGEGGVLENGVLKRPIDPEHASIFSPYDWVERMGSTGKGNGTNAQKYNHLDLFDIALLGTEQTNGRDVYVLELTANPAGRGYPHVRVPNPKSKLWVDQQLFFILRSEAYNANGEVVARGSFETIEFNQPLDPAVFDFSSPADK